MTAKTVCIPTPALPHLQPGQRAIPLYRAVGPRNARQYATAAYAVVDDIDYRQFSHHRWMAMWSKKTRSYYGVRFAYINEKLTAIYLHREVLGLPRNPGHRAVVGDHINHVTTDCTRGNLRPANRAESVVNRRRNRNTKQRYRGVHRCGKKYQARIGVGRRVVYFPMVERESHAGWQYGIAADLLYPGYAFVDPIPPEEQPAPEEQHWLKQAVIDKLKARGLI